MRPAVALLALAIAVGIGAVLVVQNRPTGQPFDPEPEDPGAPEATVAELVGDPAGWYRQTVVVRDAEAIPLEDAPGFVLAGDRARILVHAPAGAPGLEAGDTVTVRGELRRFMQPGAEALGGAFADAEGLALVPSDEGDAYLRLDTVAR